MARAAADVSATSFGSSQSSGASASPNDSAAPHENPTTPAQNTVQALAEVMIPMTQMQNSAPNIKKGHRFPCSLSAVSNTRKDAGTCPALSAVRVSPMSSWWPLAFRQAGSNPLRQKYVLVTLPSVRPMRQLRRLFHFGNQPAACFAVRLVADLGTNMATAMAVAINGTAHTPSATLQFPATKGRTSDSIVATGMISPMMRPFV